MKAGFFIRLKLLAIAVTAFALVGCAEDVAVKPSSSTLDSGLLLNMPFNGNFQDEGPLALTSSSTSTPTLTADRHGNMFSAYDFTGASSNFIEVAHVPELSPPVYSQSVWFAINNIGVTRQDFLIGKGVSYEIHTSGATTDDIRVISAGFPDAYLDSATGTITAGWHHVVATYDGVTIQIYYDGALLIEQSGYASIVDNTLNTTNLFLGIRAGGGGLPLDGQLDDVRMYNRVLSAAEVAALYNM